MPVLTKVGRGTIRENAINSAKLEDGTVVAADLAENSVGASELIEGDSYQMVNLTATGNASVTGNVSTTGTTLSKGALTVGDSSANTNFTIPTARGTQDQVLKYPSSGTTLTWGNISVSGYNGVAWFYKVESAQTIPVNKAIVVPGPMEIASGGTVTVNGRLHVI